MKMKKKNRHNPIVFTLIILVSGTLTAWGQEAATMSERYVANYDSLMDGFYMRKVAKTSTRAANHGVPLTTIEAIPDSVFEARLKALHTVIPMTYNSNVRSYINMYLNKMSYRLDVMLALCAYYHPMFEEVLHRYNVPEELKYLTIVESALNPQATSRVGAAGLWQFMYHTGKNYGMEVNSVVDDRRDPYKSTVAAARYLRNLYEVFNDWTLAIAAYNCGPGNITKAISRSGGKHNFWQIYPYLPRETRGYIPAFIAATYVMNYYPEHGLKPQHITLPIHADTVMLKHDAMFCYITQYTGVTRDELHSLNPQYRIDLIPASSGKYSLTLPTNKIDKFIEWEDSIYHHTADSLSRKDISSLTKDDGTTDDVQKQGKGKKKNKNKSRVHIVRKGETLSSISHKYGVSVKELRRKNKLRSGGNTIRPGQKIKY